MAKPPDDANPEKFIIGRGAYTNLRTSVSFSDHKEFRIDPAPMPVMGIVILNIVFIMFFGAICWVFITYGDPWIALAGIGIGTLTSVLYTAMTYYSFRKARREGPWLVVDKKTEKVSLPREGVEFDADEVVHLQYITTKRLDFGGVLNNDPLSEINLVTCVDGDRKRWPILRSIANVNAFEYLIDPMLESTNIPVVRIVDEWLGWNTTETVLRSKSPEKTDSVNRSGDAE